MDKQTQLAQALADAGAATKAIRTGADRSHEMEHAEPIFMTSSYVFDSAEDAAARFSGEVAGNVYSRYTNPTLRQFEQRLAAMEGGEAACSAASGMAAIMAVAMAFLQAGDHVICSQSVFGSTTVMFDKYFAKFGVTFSYVKLTDLDAWRDAMQPNTRLLFCESPSNPTAEVADIAALASIANAASARLVVDNCFCTPVLQTPLALGAHLVCHSATKYIDGQGRCLGGAVVGSQQDINEVVGVMRSAGPTLSPFNAWLLLKGLETLKVRMAAHCASAQTIAEWLLTQPVEKVHYAGLPDHPGHALAKRQQSGFGGVVSFVVPGGRAAAWNFINATCLMSITANLGDAKTTITHPASTSHGRWTQEMRAQAGIEEGLIRIAVGLEDQEDLMADLQRGFAAL